MSSCSTPTPVNVNLHKRRKTIRFANQEHEFRARLGIPGRAKLLSFLRRFRIFLQFYDQVSSDAEGVVEDDLVLFWHCRETHADVIAHRVAFPLSSTSPTTA